MTTRDIETLKAARIILQRHGFDGENLGDQIAAAEQANRDEDVAFGKPAGPDLEPGDARNRRTRAAIVGTLETVHACADIERFSRDPAGNLNWEHSGNTNVWWDELRTVQRDGGAVFIDAEGNEVLEADVELVAAACHGLLTPCRA